MTMHKVLEMAMAQEAIKEGLRSGHLTPCGCIGPQNGQPLCPCAMKSLVVKGGRYVQIIDHGPAPKVGSFQTEKGAQ